MRAAWYEKQGPAREVLKITEMADPTPGPGQVRIRMVASGINPGDIKKRQDWETPGSWRVEKHPRLLGDLQGIVDLMSGHRRSRTNPRSRRTSDVG